MLGDPTKDAASALAPLAGRWASELFAFGLFNASLFAASILPLSTAYLLCEALGFEAGVDKTWGEAPAFYGLYTALVAVGAGIILLPNVPLIPIMLWSQVINGILLPLVLIFMLNLINDPDLMGEHVNSKLFNVISWFITIIMILLTTLLVVTSIYQGLFQ
jgi:Mn2+/Fe2+ NRAMP family transporter